MGYTHYWGISKTKGRARELEALYQKAIKDCNRVIKHYYKLNKGTDNSLSGYSAHAKNYGGLNVNGARDNGCEDFYMREHFSENIKGGFCKTARLPYDVVVVACLSILKFHLKDNFHVNSDGNYEDWINGVDLANKVLKRTKNKVTSPIEFIPNRDLRLA